MDKTAATHSDGPAKGGATAGPYSGTVSVKDKTGSEEAALLAVRAMQEAVFAIVADVVKASAPGDRIAILAPQDVPKGGNLATFRLQLAVLTNRLTSVTQGQVATKAAPQDAPFAALLGGITPALISGQLDALNDILKFFKSNYETGGIDAKVDDSLVVLTAAGMLVKRNRPANVPSLYHANAGASEALEKELAPVLALRSAALERQEALAAATDAKSKEETQDIAAALSAFDAFVTALTGMSQSGSTPLDGVLDDLGFEAMAANGGLMLLVHVENSGGMYYDKQGLISGLFGMPLYFAGGTTISYVLTRGRAGEVLGAAAVPVYGGFVKAGALRRKLQGPIPEDPPLFQRLW